MRNSELTTSDFEVLAGQMQGPHSQSSQAVQQDSDSPFADATVASHAAVLPSHAMVGQLVVAKFAVGHAFVAQAGFASQAVAVKAPDATLQASAASA
jgi:hypothetical protein